MLTRACLLMLAQTLLAEEQNLDALLNKKAVNCWDIGYNAGQLMPRLSKEGKNDSLAAVATYWENKCGKNEPLERFEILQNIRSGKNEATGGDSGLVDDMLYYKDRIELLRKNPDNRQRINDWYSYSPPPEFDDFTADMAEKTATTGGVDRRDSLFLIFYQNKFDAFFDGVYAPGAADPLSREFQDRVKKAKGSKKLSMGLLGGAWVPTGNASLLGNHPVLGFYMGGAGGKLAIDFDLQLKFVSTENPYRAMIDDTVRATSHFLGGFLGLEFLYDITRKGNLFDPYAVAGFGWDGFDTQDSGDKKKNADGVNSFNVNVGLGNRFYYSRFAYFAFEARCNFVRYDTHGGSNLDGNTLSLLLKWGFLGNQPAAKTLEQLGYDGRY